LREEKKQSWVKEGEKKTWVKGEEKQGWVREGSEALMCLPPE
jgi:hypothetical protein